MSDDARSNSPPPRSPPPLAAKRPKGILKHASFTSPPTSPTVVTALPSIESDAPLSAKELTLHNTQINAGHRRSSSAARVAARRAASRTPSQHGDPAESAESAPDANESEARLKWDEVNLYLTEQDRTAKMKIDEPKTPYAQHYDPAEDPSDDEDFDAAMTLGEPEEAVPVSATRRPSRVHVDESSVAGSVRGDDDADPYAGMSTEEIEKHKRFEEMRKKHYEMKNVASLLSHDHDAMDLDDDDDDDDESGAPPVPPLPK